MSRFGLVPFSHPFGGSYWRDPWDMSQVSTSLMTTPTLTGNSRLFDQHFGSGIPEEDILQPTLCRFPAMYVRPGRHFSRQISGLSEVKNEDTKFLVSLDVNQFGPHELTVKTVDNAVVVHGKHQEKLDEHGFIAREFTRRYVLPDNVLPEQVISSLSAEGVLTIEAPKKMLEPAKPNERMVPITATVASPPLPAPVSPSSPAAQ